MKIRDYLSRFIYKFSTFIRPKRFKADSQDIFLISYPRSGNTWVRVILAELLYGESGESLKDLEYYIPDIHFKSLRENVIDSKFHFIKSHNPYMVERDFGKYKKVIYLIRDPRDIVLSHYRYLKARGYTDEFHQFVYDWVTGRIWPTSWHSHINSWTGPGIENAKIELLIMRYEDLLSDTYKNVKKIMEFAGFQTNSTAIKKALKNSSITEMRKKENRGMRKGENRSEMQFIGEAKNNIWINQLTSEQAELIQQFANKEMEKFGYL